MEIKSRLSKFKALVIIDCEHSLPNAALSESIMGSKDAFVIWWKVSDVP
jgi:hypothetical protein